MWIQECEPKRYGGRHTRRPRDRKGRRVRGAGVLVGKAGGRTAVTETEKASMVSEEEEIEESEVKEAGLQRRRVGGHI